MSGFPALFTPGYVGHLKIKNRLIMAPMATNLATINGEITDTLIDYYRTRALGGVGLIIVEASCVDSPVGREGLCQINISSPAFVPGLQRLSEEIRACGSRAFIQLFHAGRQTSSKINGGNSPVAPSPIPCPMEKEIPHALELSEIKAIVRKFINAAHYAYTAGFDGVELHAAHGYLINEFLSPHCNHRQDEYGGSLDNRMRFLLQIITGIKTSLPGFPISVRLNIDDFVPGGLNSDESLVVCQELERAGVAIINCSCGTYESGLKSIEPASFEQGWRVYLAEAVKKAVNIPVITGGLIKDPGFAEKIIDQGQADFIFLGRALLADPQWPDKAKKNQVDDIRPCLCCNGCIGNNFQGRGVRCTVNPYTGRERFLDNRVSGLKNQAIVVGGGPAGMQAALSLQRSGSKVVIYEKGMQLGGLLNVAGQAPAKDRIVAWRDYMIREVNKAGIEVRLGEEFTPDMVEGKDIDIIVLASGSIPKRPQIIGSTQNCCVDASDILNCDVDLSVQNIAIIGGGITGCEVADYLSCKQRQVSIIEQGPYLAAGMEKKNRRDLINRLDQAGIRKLTGVKVIQIETEGVLICSPTNEKELISAELVVWATGFKEQDELYAQLKPLVPNIFIIGDAFQIRGFRDAILEGETLGAMISHIQNGGAEKLNA